MDAITSNVSGPAFLVLYALVAAGVVVWAKRAAGPDPAEPVPLVDANGDPFEIAYLRGGPNELLRFAIFELVRANALRMVATGKAKQPNAVESTGFAAGPGPAALYDAILAFCSEPRTTPEIFASSVPRVAAAVGDAAYEAELEARGFLMPPARTAEAKRALGFGVAALLALAILRLAQALALHHRNVGFLILETTVAVVVLMVAARPRRATRRGRLALQRLRAALRPPAGAGGAVGAGTVALPILVAASGLGALANTPYAPMNRIFPQTSSSGGDSGGCGSGGDSGGGDGGGGCGGGCGG